MGRPTNLDDLVSKRVVDALNAGVSLVGAAYAARISRASLMEWLARGRDGEQPYATFLDRVTEARGKAERKVVDALMIKIREGNVPAAIFWLQQRAPDEWNRKPATSNDSGSGDASAESDIVEQETDLPMLESLVAAAKSKVGT